MKRTRAPAVAAKRFALLTGLVGGCLALSPTQGHAELRYVPVTAVRLRVDSLRTSRHIKTISAGTHLVPLGEHSDFTGMYRVAAAARDTGWMAGEYLVEADDSAPSGHAFLAATATSCPKEVSRGPVKDLEDQDAGDIKTTPKQATIGQLRSLPKPAKRPADARANDAEKTVYRVSGRIIKWGKEADGDYHLVLASQNSSTATIVLEIPSPSCLDGARSDLKPLVEQARSDAEAKLGTPPNKVKALPAPVRVTVDGVGFFDFGHSTGHPPNAFELHPVLKLKFN